MKFFLTLLPLIAFAAPQGLQVVSGGAEVIGHEVRVTESSVLHWDSYSIAAHEHIHYPSPHPTLNRVTSDLPSEIYGHLSSNGPLWLINPNGIVIGESGRINAASFLASTLDLLDGPEFVFAGDRGRIEQHGVIECPGGYVMLMAAEGVEQTGTIRAEKVGIGAGREIVFMPKDALFEISSGFAKAAIQCKGLIEATRMEERGGEVYLVADRVVVEKETMLRGNDVRVLGKEVAEFYGEIEAPGGFAEVSSPRRLVFEPVRVQTRGPNGERGKLLLDPSDIVITAATDNGYTGSCPTFTPNADTMNISVTTLQACLEGPNDVVLSATSGLAGAGNITASTAALSWNSSGSLTLEAERAITISASGGLQCAGSGNITLTASGTAEGIYAGITVTAPVETATGIVTISGKGGTTGVTGVTIDSGASIVGQEIHFVACEGRGALSNVHGISITGGTIGSLSATNAISMDGTGNRGASATSSNIGVNMTSGTVQTNATGTIEITGKGGGNSTTGTTGNHGISITGGTIAAQEIHFVDCEGGIGTASNIGVSLSATIGSAMTTSAISVTGTGGVGPNATNTNRGIHLPGGTLQTTDAGTITLHGIGGGNIANAGSENNGILMQGSTLNLLTHHLTLTGEGGNGTGGANRGAIITTTATPTFTGLGTDSTIEFVDCVGGNGGGSNAGVSFFSGSLTADTISFLRCQGGSGTSNGHGVNFQGGPASLVANTISFSECEGGTSSSSNIGVVVGHSSIIIGDSSMTDLISIEGIGGSGANFNQGVSLFTGTLRTKATGTIEITGRGGTLSGNSNYGIWVSGAATLAPGIALNFTGIGGGGTGGNNYGVYVSTAPTISFSGANPTITFDSCRGGTVGGTNNIGVFLQASFSAGSSTALKFIDCQGGVGSSSHGVVISAGTTSSGSVEIEGIALSSSSIANGMYISSAGLLNATDTIEITGTVQAGAGGTCSGISFASTNSMTAGGAITLNGAINSVFGAGVTIAFSSPWTTGSSGLLDITGSNPSGSVISIATDITHSGPITIHSPLRISGTTRTITSAGTTTFASTVDAVTTGGITANAGSNPIFIQAPWGSLTPLGAVSCTGSQISVANNISTSNAALTFNGPVVLTGSSTMATSDGAIHFTDVVDGTAPGTQGLILNAGISTITIDADIGSATGLGTFEATASNVLLNADITAVQGTFDADVTVVGDLSLKKSSP